MDTTGLEDVDVGLGPRERTGWPHPTEAARGIQPEGADRTAGPDQRSE
jgi:hypothetical protein